MLASQRVYSLERVKVEDRIVVLLRIMSSSKDGSFIIPDFVKVTQEVTGKNR